jgi:hypothetical protein
MSDLAVATRTIQIDHIKIESLKTAEKVRFALERIVSKLDPDVALFLRDGDKERAKEYEAHGPKLSIFLSRDHGSLLRIAGKPRVAYQFEIGNPLTASSMTRYQLPAALYAPLRTVLYEDDFGRGIFEYDKPSSFFGQFGDERVTAVALGLDADLKDVLLRAAA